MAPLVIGDNVIIGTSGAEYGIRGYVKAFNAASGALVWTWYTIPSPQDGGWWGPFSKTTPEGDDLKRDLAQEKADSAKYADAWQHGGGSVWMTPAYDEASKTLFVAIGNPSPDLDGSIRPGDNRWTESIAAIDATNGKFKWGYQEVPHDVWDLDAVSPPVIATVGGKKVVVEAGKTGFVYVLDAATGKLIRRSAAFVPQQNMYSQPTADGVFMLPGANGGEEWSPIAVHPELGYAYTVGLHQPMHYKVHYAPWEKGRLWLGSAFVRVPDDKGGYSGEYGNVNAIDLNTGKIAWTVKTELTMMGGATATAGAHVSPLLFRSGPGPTPRQECAVATWDPGPERGVRTQSRDETSASCRPDRLGVRFSSPCRRRCPGRARRGDGCHRPLLVAVRYGHPGGVVPAHCGSDGAERGPQLQRLPGRRAHADGAARVECRVALSESRWNASPFGGGHSRHPSPSPRASCARLCPGVDSPAGAGADLGTDG